MLLILSISFRSRPTPRFRLEKRWIDPKKSVSDWFKPGEHFLSFVQIFERDAITELEKLIPHGEDIWIFVRGVDRFLRFPFRDFDDGSVARTDDGWLAIGHKSFCAQEWHAVAHELQKFFFFSRLGPIRHDHDYALHMIDIMVTIVCVGKPIRGQIEGTGQQPVIIRLCQGYQQSVK
jgi:hypothetical protein